jgi:hypothetical protein
MTALLVMICLVPSIGSSLPFTLADIAAHDRAIGAHHCVVFLLFFLIMRNFRLALGLAAAIPCHCDMV